MRIDSITIEQARNTDIIAFIKKYCGFEFSHRGGVYRCKQHSSLAVKGDRLSWYWHSKGIGGYGVIDFLIKIENMPFREAMETMRGERFVHSLPTSDSEVQRNMAQGFNSPEKSKMLILPEKANYAQSQLYDYLCNKRNIDSRIVTTLLNENKIYEDKRGNIVFVGFDEKNKPRFASLRGTSGITQFRMDCAGSDKQYGFNMTYTQSELLYVFESPIDAMSHATLTNLITGDKDSWRSDNRLSLAGTSDTALIFFLNKHSAVKQLIFCLDNDPAGREASVVMARRYAENGYYTRIELPESKDFNEDLLDITVKRKIENTKL